MSILIQKSGILSTLQDLGRTGFRRFGINTNGAIDARAVRLINILLGNCENEAIIEMHFPAAQILFEETAIIAVGGADFGAKINDTTIENWRPVFIEKNQILKFTKKTAGNRVYLSVKGGFRIEKWLDSASTNLVAKIGGIEGRNLRNNDRFFFNSKFKIQNSKFSYKISRNLIPPYSSFPTVRVIAGAEFAKLIDASKRKFESETFTINSNSNRMGFRLGGERLKLRRKLEMISSAVAFGTVQLLPDGRMIVLMADHQTSGGYPRIAHVATADLPVLAQLGANDKVNFRLISIQEAENLALEFEKNLNLLRIGVNSKYASGG